MLLLGHTLLPRSGEVVWDVVDACRQFKSCEAEKVASRDKGRHCQSVFQLNLETASNFPTNDIQPL